MNTRIRPTNLILSLLLVATAVVVTNVVHGITDNAVLGFIGWSLVAISAINAISKMFGVRHDPAYFEDLVIATLAVGVGAGIVRLADHIGNSVLTSLAWPVLAVLLLFVATFVFKTIGDLLQIQHTTVQALLNATSFGLITTAGVMNPAGTVYSAILLFVLAAAGFALWFAQITGADFDNMMRQRRRQPRRGLHRIIPV